MRECEVRRGLGTTLTPPKQTNACVGEGSGSNTPNTQPDQMLHRAARGRAARSMARSMGKTDGCMANPGCEIIAEAGGGMELQSYGAERLWGRQDGVGLGCSGGQECACMYDYIAVSTRTGVCMHVCARGALWPGWCLEAVAEAAEEVCEIIRAGK